MSGVRGPDGNRSERAWVATACKDDPQVGDALARAIQETATRAPDELALRRIWTRLPKPGAARPERTARRWALPALTGALAMVCVGLVVGSVARRRDAVSASAPSDHAPEPATPPQSAVATAPTVTGPTVLHAPDDEPVQLQLAPGAEARLAGGATLAIDTGQRPRVREGTVAWSVARPDGEPFALTAGPYRVVVMASRFDVRVVGGRVGVDVHEGALEVWRGEQPNLVRAGESFSGWTSPAAPRLIGKAGPQPRVAPESLTEQARTALQEGAAERAVTLLRRASRLGGPAGENATYELGRLLRDRLGRPEAALRVWRGYRERHPRGLLRAEVDISVVETLAMVGARAQALEEARGFLAAHPENERAPEVRRLMERLR